MDDLEIAKWQMCAGFRNHKELFGSDKQPSNIDNTAYVKILDDQTTFADRMRGKVVYRFDRGVYPTKFNYRFKERIREMFGRRCFLCGMPENENGKKLEVHHVDYDKCNMDESNFIPCCKKCHSITNGHREYWERNIKKKLNGTLDKIPFPGFNGVDPVGKSQSVRVLG